MYLPPNAREVLEAVSRGAHTLEAIEKAVELSPLQALYNLRLLIMHDYVESSTDVLVRESDSSFQTTEKGRDILLATRDLYFRSR